MTRRPDRGRTVAAVLVLAVGLSACGSDDSNPAAAGGDAASETTTDAGGMGESGMDMSDRNVGAMMHKIDEVEWEEMRVELAEMEPMAFTLFEGTETREVTPTPEDSVHLMALLSDIRSGERLPYAQVWLTLTNSDGEIVFDERMWPMLSRTMGTHYGINVPLPEPGRYDIALRVGPPQGARHPEYTDRWLQAETFDMTYQWDG